MLSVIMLNVDTLNAIMLSVAAPPDLSFSNKNANFEKKMRNKF
jgi:hypothetical protein